MPGFAGKGGGEGDVSCGEVGLGRWHESLACGRQSGSQEESSNGESCGQTIGRQAGGG